MIESLIQRACLDLLEALRLQGKPIIATRTNSGKIQTAAGNWVQLSRPGWPDISAVIAGRFVGIETKQLTGRQRKTQEDAQDYIRSAGGIYLLVNQIGVLRAYLRAEKMLNGD